MEDSYLTIKEPATGLYKEKGSRFMSFAYPLEKEEDARIQVDSLRKSYHDARHHCFAFTVGVENPKTRAFDDGEPANSAGKPILNQLLAKKISNVLLVVVRYFGGTLLGVGGLMNAYKLSAQDALNNAHVISKTINDIYNLTFDYVVMDKVMKILKEEGIVIVENNSGMSCKMTISVRKAKCEKIIHELNMIHSIKTNYIYTI